MEQNDRAEKDVISLLDEEGKEHEFEIVDALELDDRQYLALVPLYDESQAAEALEDSGELVILRVSDEEDEDGEVYATTCPNCEEEIFFDETILADGGVECPNCGEKLDFDLEEDCGGCCGACGEKDEESEPED